MTTFENRYRQVFPGRHAVLPVIHVASEEQAVRNVRIARDAGADGVFLINHDVSDDVLFDVHAAVVEAVPGFWTGVNCLGVQPVDVFAAVSPDVGGVWTDQAGIVESAEQQPYAERVLAARDAHRPGCLYFGGVAFKYQRRVHDLEAARRIAGRYMDVITTSGPGTGLAADVAKIQRMKRSADGVPLAIASGITPENVAEYLPHADCFLVATGISESFTELDPERTLALVQRVAEHAG